MRFVFYAQRLDAGDQRQPYLNNLRISQAMTVTLATPADAANDVTLRPTLTWNFRIRCLIPTIFKFLHRVISAVL